MNKKNNYKIIVLFLVIIFILTASFSCALIPGMKDAEPETTVLKGIDTEIEIEEGMSLNQIAALLEEKKIIDSALVFKLYAEEKGFEKKLLPGNYILKTGSEYDDVLAVITSGPVLVTFKLLIPEGFTVMQISERILNELPFIDDNDLGSALDVSGYDYEFLKEEESTVSNLEGFLFPKTYEILVDYSAKNLIEMMLSQYQFETSSLDYSQMQDKGFSSYDILIIASMIEKEAYIAEERPLISAVIHNRLETGMTLGIDAVLTYYLDKWDEPLTMSDLETDTPFNTRLYGGLPPTPICNPGIESIKAALSPADVDYLFYVVTDSETHSHSFSKTLEEHNENINSTTNSE